MKLEDATIHFRIDGIPKTKENKGNVGNKRYYYKKHGDIVKWELDVAKLSKEVMKKNGWKGPWLGRVGMVANFTFKDHRLRDLTNFWKSLNDAMNGVVYKDDCQIDFAASARMVDKTDPGIEVWLFFYDYEIGGQGKKPNPWKDFDISDIGVPDFKRVAKKQTRKRDTLVGKFRELEDCNKNGKKEGSDKKPKYTNNARKNGKKKPTRRGVGSTSKTSQTGKRSSKASSTRKV